MYVQEPGAASIGAARWLPPPRSRCRSHGGPGEPKRPRAYTSASRSCREKRERNAGSQPLPPARRCWPGRSWLSARRAGAGAISKKKIKEGNPYRRSRFPHGYPWGLIAHLSLHPFFILAPFWAALSFPLLLSLRGWGCPEVGSKHRAGAELQPGWPVPGKHGGSSSVFMSLGVTRCSARPPCCSDGRVLGEDGCLHMVPEAPNVPRRRSRCVVRQQQGPGAGLSSAAIPFSLFEGRNKTEPRARERSRGFANTMRLVAQSQRDGRGRRKGEEKKKKKKTGAPSR